MEIIKKLLFDTAMRPDVHFGDTDEKPGEIILMEEAYVREKEYPAVQQHSKNYTW